MRILLSSLTLAVAAVPAAAQQSFAPQSFQIWGAIEDGNAGIPLDNRGAGMRPEDRRSRTVAFESSLPPGSILVKTGARRLYFILPGQQAIEYEVGVGREGFTWSGTDSVSRKAEWPDWRPPPEMIARERRKGHELAAFMPGGPDNPLGARAIYIGHTAFRIHGTNQAWSIGRAVSSGCIRMMNADVVDLYGRVELGASVVVEE